MSIINDAIKKARKEFEVKKKAVPDSIAEREMPVDKERPAEPTPESSEIKWTVIVVVSLVLVASLLGSVLLYKHMSKSDTAYNPAMLKAKKGLSDSLGTTHHKIGFPSVEIDDVLELNGIVYGPKEKWAIINNKIVREGEILLDGRLAVVAKDFVRIEKDGGEEIILELK